MTCDDAKMPWRVGGIGDQHGNQIAETSLTSTKEMVHEEQTAEEDLTFVDPEGYILRVWYKLLLGAACVKR